MYRDDHEEISFDSLNKMFAFATAVWAVVCLVAVISPAIVVMLLVKADVSGASVALSQKPTD